MIKLSASKFKEMWGSDMCETTTGPVDDASEISASLHEKVRLLRNCYSVESVEQASLEIAASLLATALHPSCDNIFLVLNQAASFASKGRKGGNNDRHFKGSLPTETGTPREMMVVLGRADCLNSIGFVAEASFLVSFVVMECAKRRHDAEVWNDRWRFVSMFAYNLSVITRASITSVFGDLFVWGNDAIIELGKARDDGLKLLGEVQVHIPPEDEDDLYMTDDEEAEGERAAQRKRKPAAAGNTTDEEEFADDEEDDTPSEPELSSDEDEERPTKKRGGKRKGKSEPSEVPPSSEKTTPNLSSKPKALIVAAKTEAAPTPETSLDKEGKADAPDPEDEETAQKTDLNPLSEVVGEIVQV